MPSCLCFYGDFAAFRKAVDPPLQSLSKHEQSLRISTTAALEELGITTVVCQVCRNRLAADLLQGLIIEKNRWAVAASGFRTVKQGHKAASCLVFGGNRYRR